MECSEIRLKLDEYIKNRLQKDINDKVAFHLNNCHECFEEFNTLKELNDFINVERAAYPRDAFTLNIMNIINNEKLYDKRFVFNRFSIMNLGASLVMTGLLIMLINMPFMNIAIKSCSDRVQYSAAALNTNINSTTDSFNSYISNIWITDYKKNK